MGFLIWRCPNYAPAARVLGSVVEDGGYKNWNLWTQRDNRSVCPPRPELPKGDSGHQ